MNHSFSPLNARQALDINAAARPFLDGIDALFGPENPQFAVAPILHFDSPTGDSLVLGETLAFSPISDDFASSDAAGDLVGAGQTLLTTNAGDSLTSSGLDNSDKIAAAIAKARESLQSWRDSNNFASGVRAVYGNQVDVGQAAAWLDSLLADSGAMHNLQVVDGLGAANGAYAAANDTIYLSERFVSNPNRDVNDIARVIIEELGHALDVRLNETDTAGDEGALFAAAVTGEQLSAAERAAIAAENDSATVMIDGQELAVEQNDDLGDALLLTASTTLNSYEQLVSNRLTGLGFTVVTASASTFERQDASYAELLITTASSGFTATEMDDLGIPIIALNSSIYDEFRMVASTSGSWLQDLGNVALDADSHPIADGIDGQVSLFNSAGWRWLADPLNSATPVIAETGGYSSLFAYDVGAALADNQVADARMVAFLGWPHDVPRLSTVGWRLFDNAVSWAVGATAAPALEIDLSLNNDTGLSSTDNISWDPTIAGQLTNAGTITSLQARISEDGSSTGSYFNVADTLQADGSFILDEARLVQLSGGYLARGEQTLEVRAQNATGSVDTLAFTFTYDQAPDAAPDALLLTASTTPNSYEQLISNRLSGLGFNVINERASTFERRDAVYAELLVATASSGFTATEMDDLGVPVIALNSSIYDEFRMVASTGGSWVQDLGNVSLDADSHPIADGIDGQVSLFDSAGWRWLANPLNSATPVIAETGGYSSLFAYDVGAALADNQVADARMVAFLGWPHDVPRLSTVGWRLFDNAVSWAVGATAAPALEIELALNNDTGLSSTDNISWDPTIAGQLTNAGNITSLQARISENGNSNSSYFNIVDTLQADGSFILDEARLVQLSGGYLAHGEQTLEVRAQNATGSVDTLAFTFTYDQAPGAAPDALLLTASTTPNSYEQLISNRLSGLGFTVITESASTFERRDADYAELLITTASSGFTATEMDDLRVPIIALNSSIYDEFRMVASTGGSWVQDLGNVSLDADSHPIADGIDGQVSLFNSAGWRWLANPLNSATPVIAETGGYSSLFAYDVGAALADNQVAEARMVAFLGWPHDVPRLSATGWQLFDNAVNWAVEGTGEPLELVLALTNDTGSSDSDGLTADPSVLGQLSDADNITSLQARIGDGQYVDISDTLQADGSFNLDLERLGDINGGSLAYGNYTMEILAQAAGGVVASTTVDLSYEFQQAPLPYSNGEWVPLALEAGANTFQFGLPGDIANEDQLLVYLLNENDPTDTLLSNGPEGNPLLSGTGQYLSYDPGLVSIADQTVTVDVSSLTPAELDAAAVYFLVFSEIESAPAAAPVYYSYSGGGGFGGGGGGGFGGFGSLSRFDYTNTSAGGATAGSGGDSTPDDPGSGGGGSDPAPAPAEKQFLTRLGDGDYVVAYGLLNEADSFTKPTEIKFGSNVLTLNYSDTGVFEGSSNDELLDVVLAAVGLTSLDSLTAAEITANETKSLLPSAQTLQLQDVWSRIGDIALKPNKDYDQLTQDKQLKLLNFQEDLIAEIELLDEFVSHKDNKDLLATTNQIAVDLLTNENSLLSFSDLYGDGAIDFDIFSAKATRKALAKAGMIDPDSELAWLAAITYSKVLSSESIGSINFTEGYSIAKTTLNRAKLMQSNVNSVEFGTPLNGSSIKGVIQNHEEYESLAYNESMMGLGEGFDENSKAYAESALEAVLLSLSTDIINNLSLLEEQYRVEEQGNRQVDNVRTNKEVLQYLRSHTRQGYTDGAFEDALGEQPYRGSELDPDTTLAGEYIDFGHFIASLAGQFGGVGTSGVAGSAVYNIGAGVSWSGDLGTAVISVVDGGSTAREAMVQFAGNEDLAADIAAVVVGDMLSGSGREDQSITMAIQTYDSDSGGFPEHVRTFVRNELSGQFGQPLRLTNVDTVRENIEAGIRNFLFKNPYRNEYNSTPGREERESLAIASVANEFVQYLSNKGNFSV